MRLLYSKHSRQLQLSFTNLGPVCRAWGWHAVLAPVPPLVCCCWFVFFLLFWAATQREWVPPSVSLGPVARSNQPAALTSSWCDRNKKQEQKAAHHPHHILSSREAVTGHLDVYWYHERCYFTVLKIRFRVQYLLVNQMQCTGVSLREFKT